MSRFLPEKYCPDIGNNEHNSDINAYNSVKTAEMLPYCHSARLPAHPDAHIFLLYYGQSNSFAQVQDLCAKALAN